MGMGVNSSKNICIVCFSNASVGQGLFAIYDNTLMARYDGSDSTRFASLHGTPLNPVKAQHFVSGNSNYRNATGSFAVGQRTVQVLYCSPSAPAIPISENPFRSQAEEFTLEYMAWAYSLQAGRNRIEYPLPDPAARIVLIGSIAGPAYPSFAPLSLLLSLSLSLAFNCAVRKAPLSNILIYAPTHLYLLHRYRISIQILPIHVTFTIAIGHTLRGHL